MHKTILTLSLCGVLCGMAAPRADEPQALFDGEWTTVVACPPADGALPYSYEFVSSVKGSVLHGERGVAGAPGWLKLEGLIRGNGAAVLAAHGIVGSEHAAIGERPRGTPYSYRLEARFSGDAGSGHRTNGRNCTVTFARKMP